MRYEPLTARAKTAALLSGKPVLAAVQVMPLLAERKTPPEVPATRLAPLAKRAKTYCTPIPEVSAIQLEPLSGERKMPLLVPARRLVPIAARALTVVSDGNPL